MLEYFETLHWGSVIQIVIIDLLLGGDNAVVIALACRNLPRDHRLKGIIWGTAGAIVIRLALIAFALTLLNVPYLKIAGGLLLVWIGVRLMAPEHKTAHAIDASASIMTAVKTIIVADLVMSLDNVVAIAAAAQLADPQHQFGLVVFGLLVSVPIIVWGSTLVLRLIDRFPIVITLGAGLLGWIAGGMLIGDVAITSRLGAPEPAMKWLAEGIGALMVVGIGWALIARRKAHATTQEQP